MYDYNTLTPIDLSGDGTPDGLTNMIDSDGDGILDMTVLYQDTTGDGQIDTTTYLIDTNLDGEVDATILAVDTDGNMVPDTFISMFDTTGNGEADTIVKSHDYNQDGIIDSSTTYTDSNGDGNPDIVTKQYASNDGGPVNTVEIFHDLTGDGKPDYVEKQEYWDTDYDGIADTVVAQVDRNGNGDFEATHTFALNTHTGEIIPPMDYMGAVGGTFAEDLPNFDPAESDPALVTGDPARAMECWEFQGPTNRCALYSQKFVIEELTGQEVDIEELTATAEANGWFTENGGTTFLNMNNMLDAYGVENEMSFHNDIDGIKECLENGDKVIVSIDADQIWYGESSNIFAPDNGANHAVQVIGIDYSDPDNPMVVLNDSGSRDGKGEMVPLEVFEDAWEAGDCQMITCYA